MKMKKWVTRATPFLCVIFFVILFSGCTFEKVWTGETDLGDVWSGLWEKMDDGSIEYEEQRRAKKAKADYEKQIKAKWDKLTQAEKDARIEKLESDRERARDEANKKAEDERAEASRERERQEAERTRLKKEWAEFIQNGEGTLENKTSLETKKLVDYWREFTPGKIDGWGTLPLLEDFYKVFGKPLRVQVMESTNSGPYSHLEGEYHFWYSCKGGIPRITLSSFILEGKDESVAEESVLIVDISIF